MTTHRHRRVSWQPWAAVLVWTLLQAAPAKAQTSERRLRETVDWLASPDREGRRAGSDGAQSAASWIQQRFQEIASDVQVQDFGINRRNVVARIGTAERFLVIGSHYDGQGPGMPSASDNGAGIAVLLEIGRSLKGARLPVSVLLVAFDDEEQGLIGSRYYVDHPLYPLDRTVAAIILDTMGRSFLDLSAHRLMVLGTESSEALSATLRKHRTNTMLDVGTDLIGPRSDYAPFAVKKIPFLFFTHATHRDYHGPGDTADRLNYAVLAADAARIVRIARDVAQLDAVPPSFDRPAYPEDEKGKLLEVMAQAAREKPDLPRAYALSFEDLRSRLATDTSRDTLRLATSVLLALATPRLSGFLLEYFIAPFYERSGKHDIAIASYEEALRWTDDNEHRAVIEAKLKTLKPPPMR